MAVGQGALPADRQYSALIFAFGRPVPPRSGVNLFGTCRVGLCKHPGQLLSLDEWQLTVNMLLGV